MDTLLRLDWHLTSLLSSILGKNGQLDNIFLFFSFEQQTWIVWIVFVMILLVFYKKNQRILLMQLSTGLFTTLILVNYVLKNLIGRARPWEMMQEINRACPSDYSFPSSHAALAFAAATVFSFHDRKNAVWYYLVAGMIGYSRIYLHCHYLGDVLAGGLIGWLISRQLIKIIKL